MSDEPLAHRIVAYLRSTGGSISRPGLCFRLDATGNDVSAALAELCASGPLVAIVHGDACYYALEWGVLAPWETAP